MTETSTINTAQAFDAADFITLLEEHLSEVGKHVILETRAGDEVKVRTEVDESTPTELVVYAIDSATDVDYGRFRVAVQKVEDVVDLVTAAPTSTAEPLDPIGYDDALLIRAALRRLADQIKVDLEAGDVDVSDAQVWTRDLIRLRWLAGRGWYGCRLNQALDANDREDAMRQLEVIARGVYA